MDELADEWCTWDILFLLHLIDIFPDNDIKMYLASRCFSEYKINMAILIFVSLD